MKCGRKGRSNLLKLFGSELAVLIENLQPPIRSTEKSRQDQPHRAENRQTCPREKVQNPSDWPTRKSFRCCELFVEPFLECGRFSSPLDGRNVPVAGNQERPRYIALPGGIDFIAQSFRKTVTEHPVLGHGEAGSLQHRQRRRVRIRNQVGIDGYDIDGRMLLLKLTQFREFDLARSASYTPKMHQGWSPGMRMQDLPPASPLEGS